MTKKHRTDQQDAAVARELHQHKDCIRNNPMTNDFEAPPPESADQQDAWRLGLHALLSVRKMTDHQIGEDGGCCSVNSLITNIGLDIKGKMRGSTEYCMRLAGYQDAAGLQEKILDALDAFLPVDPKWEHYTQEEPVTMRITAWDFSNGTGPYEVWSTDRKDQTCKLLRYKTESRAEAFMLAAKLTDEGHGNVEVHSAPEPVEEETKPVEEEVEEVEYADAYMQGFGDLELNEAGDLVLMPGPMTLTVGGKKIVVRRGLRITGDE